MNEAFEKAKQKYAAMKTINSDEVSGSGQSRKEDALSFRGTESGRVSYDYPFLRQIGMNDDLYFLHEKINTRYYRRQKDTKSNFYLVQDIRAHQEPIWAAEFSPCGHYLATGGKDGVLKIWATYKQGK